MQPLEPDIMSDTFKFKTIFSEAFERPQFNLPTCHFQRLHSESFRQSNEHSAHDWVEWEANSSDGKSAFIGQLGKSGSEIMRI